MSESGFWFRALAPAGPAAQPAKARPMTRKSRFGGLKTPFKPGAIRQERRVNAIVIAVRAVRGCARGARPGRQKSNVLRLVAGPRVDAYSRATTKPDGVVVVSSPPLRSLAAIPERPARLRRDVGAG